MKTSLNETWTWKDKALPPFPFLAQSTHEDPKMSFTVLFVNEHSGTVVHRASEQAAWKVGTFYEGFTNVCRSNHWRVLSPSETITLQND